MNLASKRLVSQTCAWKSLHPKNGHRLAFSRYLSTHSFTLQPCSVDHFSAMRSVSALKGVEKVAVRLTKVLSLLPSPFKSSPSSVILDLSWSPSLLNYSIHNFKIYFVPNSREKFWLTICKQFVASCPPFSCVFPQRFNTKLGDNNLDSLARQWIALCSIVTIRYLMKTNAISQSKHLQIVVKKSTNVCLLRYQSPGCHSVLPFGRNITLSPPPLQPIPLPPPAKKEKKTKQKLTRRWVKKLIRNFQYLGHKRCKFQSHLLADRKSALNNTIICLQFKWA